MVDAIAEHGRRCGELGARVDALGLGRIFGGVDGDPLAACDELANRVGQVELALSVLGAEPVERGPELVRLEDVDRGVDLAQRELVLACVGGLDDRLERPVGVPDDAAVGAGLFGLEGEHRGSRALGAVGLEEPAEQLAGDRGGIAGDHEHVTFEPREGLLRRGGRVTRAARLGLHSDLDALEGVLRPGRGDDHERLGLELAGGLDHPVDEPAPEERVQVLGRLRAHARAEPGGQDDGCEIRRVHRDGWGARIRTWDRGTKTRCLTTWLRPTVNVLLPKIGRKTAARAKPARPLGRRRKRRLSTWLGRTETSHLASRTGTSSNRMPRAGRVASS